MNDIEKKLNKISYRDLTDTEQSMLWQNIRLRKSEVSSRSLLEVFNLKFMPALIIAILVLLGGGGSVVALADSARPGDALFGIDLATERVELALAKKEKKEVLIKKFAEERINEVESFDKSTPIEVDEKVNLGGQDISEMEAEVFTNETVVKIEANNKKYGFTTNLKERAEVVALIVARYGLEQSIVEGKLVFKTEDRASRPEDKGFVNGKSKRVDLSEDEKSDFEHGINQALNQIDKNDNISPELRSALEALLLSSGERKIEIERDGQEVKIESKNGLIKIKVENQNDDDDEIESSDDEGDEVEDIKDDKSGDIEEGDDTEDSIDDIDEDSDDEEEIESSDDEEDEIDDSNSGKGKGDDDIEEDD